MGHSSARNTYTFHVFCALALNTKTHKNKIAITCFITTLDLKTSAAILYVEKVYQAILTTEQAK